jgi:PAS domain S-box-containing protein
VLPDALFIVDREGKVVRINCRTEQLFAYSASELDGHFVEIRLAELLRERHVELRER